MKLEEYTDEQMDRLVKWNHTARFVGVVAFLALYGLLKLVGIL